jgi:hypothetical protein
MTGPSKSGATAPIGPAIRNFGLAQFVLIALMAAVFATWIFPEPAGRDAVIISACLAFFVQMITFTICKLVARDNIMAAWGLGALLRLATLVAWGFLGVKALELAQTPVLISLASYFFVSTLVEPLFLNN